MPRTLLITSVLPWPLHRNGGAQRTALLRRALVDLGRDVDVLAVLPDVGDAPPSPESLAAERIVGLFSEPIHLPPSTRESNSGGPLRTLVGIHRLWAYRYAARSGPTAWLDANLRDYDRIYVRYLQTALLCGLDARPADVRARCRIDLDDVDWLTLKSRFDANPWPGPAGKLGMWRTLRQVRRRCRDALAKFPPPFVASEEDSASVAQATVLPNVPFDVGEPLPASDPASRVVLFVGDLKFPPNADGLSWFIAEVWPSVAEEVADARLRIVGRGMTESNCAIWSACPGVEAVGFADDLRAEYAKAAATVAPVWWGGGTKIKVVESAALGRACVASEPATRGFGRLVRNGVTAAIDDENFAANLIEFLTDAAKRHAAEEAGPQAAAEHYSFAAFRAAVRHADGADAAGR